MWVERDEFEQEVARYWEEQEDADARDLSRQLTTHTRRIFGAQSVAGRLFKRLHDGVSHQSHHVVR